MQGGLQSQQAAYLKAMSKAGFDEGTPVYVASGVFSRNDAVPASEYIAQVQYSPPAISLQLNTVGTCDQQW